MTRGVRVGVRPNTSEWLAWRAQGITAGDAAVILGLSPWGSPFDLWWQKRNDRAAVAAGEVLAERARSQRFEIGHAVEPILHRFHVAEVLPDDCRLGAGGCWQGRGDRSWLRATPDRCAYPNKTTRTPAAVVEFKTSGRYDQFGADDGDGVPDIPVYYRAQMLHQFLAVGVGEGFLTVLTAGMQIRHYRVVAKPGELEVVYDAVAAFEESLHDDVPPDIDGHDATEARLKQLWGDVEDEPLVMHDTFANEVWDAKLDADLAERNLAYARNRLLDAMGNARKAMTADGRKVAGRSVRSNGTFALTITKPDKTTPKPITKENQK